VVKKNVVNRESTNTINKPISFSFAQMCVQHNKKLLQLQYNTIQTLQLPIVVQNTDWQASYCPFDLIGKPQWLKMHFSAVVVAAADRRQSSS